MKKSKIGYVDGFVLSVPKKNVGRYKKMARQAKDVWMRFGAIEYKECKIDDIQPPLVTFTFPKMAKAKPSDTVWFSFITYKDKKHRDAVNKNVMAYFDKKYGKKKTQMPFDMKRLAFGGFTVEV